ncbi:MAG: outer-membrane lipoprotein carrier protein LolA [Hyphomicrobiaceae bacterium]|nr:outer-membrane lipoprotein carrier protein LolA [Hyphomicrobiaceae bacterium]
MAAAQTAKGPATPEWNQTVTKEPSGEFDAKQLDLIKKMTGYFNDMGDMKGAFEQTSPDGKKLRGWIAVKRPSFFRFEYRRPSRQLIISDGKTMIVQDLDLKTDDRWGLDQTPFKIVMRKDVDLMRDAKVLEVGESDNRFYISLEDKDPGTVGRLKLMFQKKPAMELKEWITTDRQGLDTKVELTEFAKADDLDPKLFEPTAVTLQKLQQ